MVYPSDGIPWNMMIDHSVLGYNGFARFSDMFRQSHVLGGVCLTNLDGRFTDGTNSLDTVNRSLESCLRNRIPVVGLISA